MDVLEDGELLNIQEALHISLVGYYKTHKEDFLVEAKPRVYIYSYVSPLGQRLRSI